MTLNLPKPLPPISLLTKGDSESFSHCSPDDAVRRMRENNNNGRRAIKKVERVSPAQVSLH